mmetsp:Transcript_21055/g.34226  ORF Transcript_21055/g.34226 Transcript_21055/m.34226 type:complete len:471 (-) Transcript_21055:1074-2486(-)
MQSSSSHFNTSNQCSYNNISISSKANRPASAKANRITYCLQQPRIQKPSTHFLTTPQKMNETGNTFDKTNALTTPLDRTLRRPSWTSISTEVDNLVAKKKLIQSNVSILESFLLKIAYKRSIHSTAFDDQFIPSLDDLRISFSEDTSEKVMFPNVTYCGDDNYGMPRSENLAMSDKAQTALYEYVTKIASMYRDIPFHNFEHASHVTMSANKLLNRICTPYEDEDEEDTAARTFGISADPLAQFVAVFSALVHDVDHRGVPNAQLVAERSMLAIQFNNRNVAEKRSITLAWNVLMRDRFRELQSLIFVNAYEMRRFKQLLVNTVLATDISDKERSAIGKLRWQEAFHPSQSSLLDEESSNSRFDDASLRSLKATLVLEQIMQASDVAHTMQHWKAFTKWNKRLYRELSKGYREGRGSLDPREGWCDGEIGFFDFYIIPLAKKLKECGVFGSAASEYYIPRVLGMGIKCIP